MSVQTPYTRPSKQTKDMPIATYADDVDNYNTSESVCIQIKDVSGVWSAPGTYRFMFHVPHSGIGVPGFGRNSVHV